MATNNIVPDSSQLTDPSYGVGAPSSSVNVSQTPPPAAPAPAVPAVGPRLASTLGAIVSASTPSPAPATPAPNTSTAPQQPAWKKDLSTVARTVSTGLAGIPDKGRPSFISGLGSGARAENAAQAAQQEIKFRTFDDQVRAANLHNQDLQMQQQNEDQQAARQAAVDFQTEAIGKQGGTIDTHPNDGTSVMQTLQAQTAANGAATITPGTHISPNGKDINIPANNPQTMSAQLKNYKDMVGILPGLPSTPNIPDPSSVKNMSDVTNARANMGKAFDIFTHLTNGHNVDGSVYTHQQLNNLIPAYQAQIDSHTAKGDLSEYQMGTLKNTLSILQADEQNHSDAEDEANAKAAAQKAAQAGAVAGAQSQAKLPATIAAQNNAAANKAANAKPDAQMYVGTDAAGNQVAGTSDQLKTAGAQGVTKLDADSGKKVIVARELTSPDGLFAQVKQDMLNLDAKGKMGSSATARFNDALLSKAGSDPDYASLFVHTHLLATALMQAHVGSRGSSDMMDEFKQLANSGKMSAPTLRAALGAEYNYVKGKALLPKAQPSQTSNGGGQ